MSSQTNGQGDLCSSGVERCPTIAAQGVIPCPSYKYPTTLSALDEQVKQGISQDKVNLIYDDWAANYDEIVGPGQYNGPEIAAEALCALYDNQQRQNLRILDVAAGTGSVGVLLQNLGFNLNIDALEPSSGMMKLLKNRNIYSNLFEIPIGNQATNGVIDSKIYDLLILVGGMQKGHIPTNAIYEMIRLVKSGGVVLIVMREEYLTLVDDYEGKLEPLMDEMEQQGYWTKVSRTIVPDYCWGKNGLVYVYRVTSNEFPQ